MLETIDILKLRFECNPQRHRNIRWEDVETRLKASPDALEILQRMEETGGEPDVIGYDENNGKYLFCDCVAESPIGRRLLCYDEIALQKSKKNPPTGSAWQQAEEIGVKILTEELYRKLQELGEFDLKTSSWIDTPEAIWKRGGALFCERRYGEVFVFHNGVESYYAARGWRMNIKAIS